MENDEEPVNEPGLWVPTAEDWENTAHTRGADWLLSNVDVLLTQAAHQDERHEHNNAETSREIAAIRAIEAQTKAVLEQNGLIAQGVDHLRVIADLLYVKQHP